jgi:perosamine synthetase
LEKQYVNGVLDSGILSIGPMLEKFEDYIKKYIGVDHAVGVNSGTSGLHLILRALGIGEGDEVITTPFSFIASANCMLFERAVPVFIDIDKDMLNMDINKIEEAVTPKTKAILTVDVFGQPMNMVAVKKIADRHGLLVIEDSAEALGSEYNGIKAGALADAAVYAFYPNKQVVTGEGGMIVTNDEKTAMLCRSMRSQGRPVTGQWLEHERLGYNYRLSELHAALGAAQMERLDELLLKRRTVAERYNDRLREIEWVTLPFIDKNVTYMSWFVYVIRVPAGIRDRLMVHLLDNGVDCKAYFPPIHSKTFFAREYGYKPGDFPITEQAGDTCVAIPFYGALTDDEMDFVVDRINEMDK